MCDTAPSNQSFWDDYGKSKISFAELKNIVVYQGKNLGDVLLSTPVIESLRSITTANIVVCTSRESMPLVADCSRGIQWIQREKRVLRVIRSALRLRRCSVDLFVDLHGSFDSSLTNRILSPRFSVRMSGCRSRFFDSYTFDLSRAHCKGRHRIDQHLDVLRRLGVRSEQLVRTMSVSTLNSNETEESLRGLNELLQGENYVVVHPGSRWMFKTPDPEFWVATVSLLMQRGLKVVLTGIALGIEGKFLDYIHERCNCLSLGGELDLPGLSWVIKNSIGYLGVDTVASHLAEALNVPGVVLFGPSDETSWGPRGHSLVSLSSDKFQCRPCNADGCAGSKRSDCLNILEPRYVSQKLLEQIGYIE